MNLAGPLSMLAVGISCAGLAQSFENIGPPSQGSPNFVISHWDMSEGLPSDRVRSVLQSSDGYLWVATFNGLARFDGSDFRVFDDSNTPELKNRLINCLGEDSHGRLWIGSDTGEIVWMDSSGFHEVPVKNGWLTSPIFKMLNTPDDLLLVLNRDGQLLPIKDGVAGTPSGGLEGPLYSDLLLDSKKRVWAVRRGGQMHQLENGVEVPWSIGPAPAQGRRDVAPAHHGGFWVRDGLRLRRWENGAWVEDRGSHDWGIQRQVVLREISSGDVLVATENQGLFMVDEQGGENRLARTNGLSHNWVTSICEDREKDVWVGTFGGGLELLRKRALRMISPEDQWLNQPVESVTPAKAGGVWIGTLGAGVYRYDGQQFLHLIGPLEARSAFVRTLLEDRNRRLWIGTEGRGLYWWQQGEFGVPNTSFVFPRLVYGLEESGDGAIWISTQNGVVRCKDADYQRLGTDLKQSDVRLAVQAADGAIWLGMRGGGVARLQGGRFKQFLHADGLPYAYVWSMFADQDGSIWIGTAGGGLSLYRNGKFYNFTTKEGLPSNFICNIQADGLGNLWVASYGGIFRVDKNDLVRCLRGEIPEANCLVLDASDGLTSLEMSGGNQPSGCRTADGRFWFANSSGLAVVDPERIEVVRAPPPVVIEDMLVDGLTGKVAPGAPGGLRKNDAEAMVPAGSGQIEFRYAALSYGAPQRVRFKYRLEGLETDWVNAGDRHSAFYPHLAPGHYHFHVIACNRFGYWNEDGAELSFRVLPFFWQNWWFAPLCWLVGALLAGFIVVSGLRHRHQRKLEVLERSRLLERERARIAHDLHDDLGAGLTEIDTTSSLGLDPRAPPQELREYFQEISQRSREMVTALDEIVWAANPKNDNVGSLSSYFSHYAEQFLRPTGIHCHFDVPETLPELPLGSDKRHSLFLALKEALNNAVRHARAKNIDLAIRVEKRTVRISLTDDGRGFLPTVEHPGADGLASMRSRLMELGGNCEIVSQPESGTRVTFILPL